MDGKKCSILLEYTNMVPIHSTFGNLKDYEWRIGIGLRGRSQTTFTKLGFFDHLPPSIYSFYGIKVYKKSIFLTTYLPPLVNVVCERPLKSAVYNQERVIMVHLRYVQLNK